MYVCARIHARDSRNVQYTLGCVFRAGFAIPRLPSLVGAEPALRYAAGAGDTNSNGEVTHSQLST